MSDYLYCSGLCWSCEQDGKCPAGINLTPEITAHNDDGRETRSINYDNDRGVDE